MQLKRHAAILDSEFYPRALSRKNLIYVKNLYWDTSLLSFQWLQMGSGARLMSIGLRLRPMTGKEDDAQAAIESIAVTPLHAEAKPN